MEKLEGNQLNLNKDNPHKKGWQAFLLWL